MEPRDFSFNSPFGACNTCNGLGINYEIDENTDRSIINDRKILQAINVFKNTNGFDRTTFISLDVMARTRAISMGINAEPLNLGIEENIDNLIKAMKEDESLSKFYYSSNKNIKRNIQSVKEKFKETHGVSLGFMSFFTLAVVRALDKFPAVNSMVDGKEMITYDYKDISIAVSGPKGLMVPVMRNAENLGFRGVEQEVKRLALRARDGKITVDEMTGGTFTISNGGVFGSMLSTPIINPPQSGILGMHNIVERPVAIDGKVEIRPIMYLALSYDHRIIDGRESVGFLVAIKEALEDPKELLMNGNVEKALEL